MNGYPIELDLSGRKVIVVGLGAVGSRKARGAIAAGARVVGIDPKGANGLNSLEVVAEPYRAEHLTGAFLAFAAATPEINLEVVRDANRAGILVHSASEPRKGDFRTPMVLRQGPIIVTVSTSGASPSLARKLLGRAAKSLGPQTSTWVRILGELRPIAMQRYPDVKIRRRIFEDWADLDRFELLRLEEDDAIRLALLERGDQIARDEEN